jgi:hypothetical protein
MKAKIKLALNGLSPIALVNKADLILSNMTDNDHFPSPTPTLDEIRNTVNVTQTYISEAAFGDRRKKYLRDRAANELSDMLRQLASYVNLVANGDKCIIQSSGFGTQKIPIAVSHISRPIEFKVRRGLKPGEVKLLWKRSTYGKAYQVEYVLNDGSKSENGWQVSTITTKSKAMVTDLELGKNYSFRVKAIGANHTSAYSREASIMAA